jgi:hypothetical protein
MDRTIYTVKGGMEDWAYAASWIPEKVVQCQPTSFGGYAAEKTVYNESVLRVFNILFETSYDKTTSESSLGTSLNVLNCATSGNGHVSRNIRVALLGADIVEPYLQISSINNLALSTDIVPLMSRDCRRMNAVRVPQTSTSVTVEWTVGGALEIAETQLFHGNWDSISELDCMSQPSSSIESSLVSSSMLTSTTGTVSFSESGVSPSAVAAYGDSPLGPVFQATVDLTSFGSGEEIVIVAKAKVDQSWLQQPSDIAPQVLPQSHMVNARSNSSWFHQNNGKIVQGCIDWYSIIPLTLVISDTTDLQDVSYTFWDEVDEPVVTPAPSVAPTPLSTPNPTFSPVTTPAPTSPDPQTAEPTSLDSHTAESSAPAPVTPKPTPELDLLTFSPFSEPSPAPHERTRTTSPSPLPLQ